MSATHARPDAPLAPSEAPDGEASALHIEADVVRPAPAAAHDTGPAGARRPPEDDPAASLEYWYFCGGGCGYGDD